MDDVRDPLGLDKRSHGLAVGDVERDQPGIRGAFVTGHETQAAAIRREVRAEHVEPMVGQELHRPRADAAGCAGHEIPRRCRCARHVVHAADTGRA